MFLLTTKLNYIKATEIIIINISVKLHVADFCVKELFLVFILFYLISSVVK